MINRSTNSCPSIITISEGYLLEAAKLYVMYTYFLTVLPKTFKECVHCTQ